MTARTGAVPGSGTEVAHALRTMGHTAALIMLLTCARPTAAPAQAAYPACNNTFQPVCRVPDDAAPSNRGTHLFVSGVASYNGVYRLVGDSLLEPVTGWHGRSTSSLCATLLVDSPCGYREWRRASAIGALRAMDVKRILREDPPANPLSPRLPQQWRALEGLVPDGVAMPSRAAIPTDWDRCSVAIVPSSGTQRSVQQIEQLQRAVVQWGNQQSDPGLRSASQAFGDWSPSQLLARHVADAARARFAHVSFADDLTVLRDGDVDFVLVVDLDLQADGSELLRMLNQTVGRMKLEDSPFWVAGPAAHAEFSWMLLDREARVVLASIAGGGNWTGGPLAVSRNLWMSEPGRVQVADPFEAVDGRGVEIARSELLILRERLHRNLGTGTPTSRLIRRGAPSDLFAGLIPARPVSSNAQPPGSQQP